MLKIAKWVIFDTVW